MWSQLLKIKSVEWLKMDANNDQDQKSSKTLGRQLPAIVYILYRCTVRGLSVDILSHHQENNTAQDLCHVVGNMFLYTFCELDSIFDLQMYSYYSVLGLPNMCTT